MPLPDPFTAAPSGAAPAAPMRDRALDLARAVAVLAMVWTHLVPSEGARTWHAGVAAWCAAEADHAAPALFCVLAGMAWTLHARAVPPRPAFVARRALALAALGVLLGLTVWPTEILVPLALMLVLTSWIARAGTGACLGAAAASVAAVPLVTHWFGHWVELDYHEDGTPLVWSEFGTVTLRYFVCDGTYPLLPWACFPLVGVWLVRAGGAARWPRWCVFALTLAVASAALLAWTAAHGDELGAFAVHLQSGWQPTVPGVLHDLAVAVAVIAGLSWWRHACGLPRWCEPLVLVGRASLTHYVLHLVLVIAPLRHWYPDEDWSIRVGVCAALGYSALGVPLTVLWFRRHRRGPLEGLLGAVSGHR